MRFGELDETLAAEQADVARLFGGDRRVRSRSRQDDPKYRAQLFEAKGFIDQVLSGRRPMYHMKEALSTDDFPILFSDILDRELLGNYQEAPAVWQNFVRRGTVRSFLQVKRFAIDGLEGPLEEVKELEEYPEGDVNESEDTYKVAKRGKRIDLSWESLINDDLDAFRDLPSRLAKAARRSEDRFATGLFVDADGPHAALYSVANGNIIPGNPELSIEGLQAGFTQLGTIVDEDDEPIVIEAVELVVPPALEIVAQNILNATQLKIGPDSADTQLMTANWMANRTRLSVDPYIPHIATDANGNTSWFLFAQVGAGRPALEIGFLVGHEEPAIYERLPDARRVGGGEALESFYDDSRAWRVRHVFGGTRLVDTGGYRSTAASNGSGV